MTSRSFCGPATLLLFAAALSAQTPELRPPVILVNGFDVNGSLTGECESEPDSSSTFGRLEELLEADGAAVYFFDNCRFGSPPIEILGRELGRVIGGLIDESGIRPQQVDLVGFSMGALIIRAYLNGKQEPSAAFDPPTTPSVRKIVLVGGPHFGSPLADFAENVQGIAMRRASRFTWDLARWNQGFDDLRGVEALALVGSGGRGRRGDGVVGIHSASLLSFWGQTPERTRVLFACHNRAARLLCDAGDTLMPVDDEAHPVGRAIRSFLAGTDIWRSIGTPIDEHPETQGLADLYVAARGVDGEFFVDVTRIEAMALDDSANILLELRPSGVGAARDIPAGRYRILVEREDERIETEVDLLPNRTNTVLVKFGPRVARVQPAAGPIGSLSIAPQSLISIFGDRFTNLEDASGEPPLPLELVGVRVSLDGRPLGLLYAGPGQINALTPVAPLGLSGLRIDSPNGVHDWTVVLTRGLPAIFSLDGTGSGPAAALDAVTFDLISHARPAAEGEPVALFLTGLDKEAPASVLLAGDPQPMLYAGAAPGFVGLDQINFRVQAGAAPGDLALIVLQAGRASNLVTLSVQ